MKKFDIPIQITVSANNERLAEKAVFDFLKVSQQEFGNHHKIVDWQYFEFLPEDNCSTDIGCSGVLSC